MINKQADTVVQAIGKIDDGATIMVGGFGTAGIPDELIDGLLEVLEGSQTRHLTLVNNNAGNGDVGLAAILKTGRVDKLICSFPRQTDSYVFDGLYRSGVLEHPIYGDVALIKAERGDRWGNLTYRKSARNFGPVMAMAAKRTVASVHEVVPLGTLDPETIVTPSIFVHSIVQIPRTATVGGGFKKQA